MARAKLADSVVYLSEGIPAIQLGQEFLRTKGGDGNSYNTGDAVNAIDWDRTTQYADSVDYVKGLIKLRKQINALRLTDYNDINANVTMLKSADGVVAYQAEQSDGTYVVIFNANNDAAAALTSGKAAAWVVDNEVGVALAAQQGLVVLDEAMTSEPYALAFAKDSALTAQFDEALGELLADGTVAAIFEKYGVLYVAP